MRNTIQTFFFIHHQLTATVKLLCIVKARNKGRPLWPRQKWPQMNESELSGVQNLHFTLHTLNKRYLLFTLVFSFASFFVSVGALTCWWTCQKKSIQETDRLDLISSQSIRRSLRHFSLNRSVGLSNISMCGAKQAAWANPLRPHWHDVFTGNSDEFKDSFSRNYSPDVTIRSDFPELGPENLWKQSCRPREPSVTEDEDAHYPETCWPEAQRAAVRQTPESFLKPLCSSLQSENHWPNYFCQTETKTTL